jgi:hypothetical protein
MDCEKGKMKKAIAKNVGNEITFQFVYGLGEMGKDYHGRILKYDPQKGVVHLRWDRAGQIVSEDWDEELLTYVKKKKDPTQKRGRPKKEAPQTPKRGRGRPRKKASPIKITAEMAKGAKDYRVLGGGGGNRPRIEGDGVELREYSPVRRTFTIADRQYSLQFPYILFLKTNTWHADYPLAVAFARKPMTSLKSDVYYPCVPNVYTGWGICLGGVEGYSLDELIRAFWFNKFRPYSYSRNGISLKSNFGRLKQWEKMNLETVTSNLNYEKKSLENFLSMNGAQKTKLKFA